MAVYILKRLVSIIPVFVLVVIISFCIIRLTPGDPARVILGDTATEAEVQQLRDQLGLNDPLFYQFTNYVKNLLQGDFGNSIFMKMPVKQAFFEHFTPTLMLTIFSLIIAIAIALPLGILVATKRGTWVDYLFSSSVLLGVSIPGFWLGILIIRLFAVDLNWLPSGGYQPISSGFWIHLKYMILPSFTLGVTQAALIARMTRNSMLEVMNQNYIKTAKAKGVRYWVVILKHVLRNALIPIITMIGLSFAGLISGAVVTEVVYNIPGIGQLIVNSVLRRDYEVIQGTILIISIMYVLINLMVDLVYAAINPSIRYDNKS